MRRPLAIAATKLSVRRSLPKWAPQTNQFEQHRENQSLERPMQNQNFQHNIEAERLDFRTLGVLVEISGRKLSFLFEQSARNESVWLSVGDTSHWPTGDAVTDLERQQLTDLLNAWGKDKNWSFDISNRKRIVDLNLDEVPEEEREFVRYIQQASREEQNLRNRVYAAARKKPWWRFW